MTPYFRKMVWLPALLAVGALVTILGSAVRTQAWRLLTAEGCVVLAMAAAIAWMLRSVRSGEPGQHSEQEALILLLLFLIVAAGALRVFFRG